MKKNQSRMFLLFLAIIAMFGIAGCSTWDKLDKTERGAVIGTGGGAAVGAAVGGTKGALIGGVAGGVAGGVIEHEREKRDKRVKAREENK